MLLKQKKILVNGKTSKKKVIYKIGVSILFSLLAIIFNHLNIKFFEFFNFESGIIIGYFCVLVVALVWGWKYGLVALIPAFYALLDSYVFDSSYVIFLLFAYYVFWLVIHSFFSEKYKKYKRWIYNKYFIESLFLLFSISALFVMYFFTTSHNGLVMSSDVDLSYFVKFIIAEIVCRDYLVLIFTDVVLRFNVTRNLLNLEKRSKSSDRNLLAFIIVGVSVWFFDMLIKFMYFYTVEYSSIVELIKDVKPHNFLLRNSILIVFVILGILYSDKQEEMLVNKKQQELQTKNLKEVLNLTKSLSNATDIDEKDFITHLLNITTEIIPESDYGTAYIFEGDYMIPIITKNYKNQNFLNSKIDFNKTFKNHKDKETFIIRTNNDNSTNVDSDNYELYRMMNEEDVKESLFFVLKINNIKTAALCLDIDSNSNTTFTDESLEMIDLIKNIPSSYYLMMRDYESKQILYKDMIISVLKILSIYDPYTNEHSKNVADLSVLLAKQLKVDELEIEKIYWAALVHDIGKILIPKEILDKKSRLNDEEYNVVKMHPVWGYETLKSNESLTDIAHVVKHHHERWDGKGYPDGLKTKNIPYYSRIVAVADSYDAMRTDRPYRLTMSKEEAINEITINSMKQFDPMVVDAFILIANEL